MKVEQLVKMANEIAAFYTAESGATAAADIALHLKRFWEPRMRKAIVEHQRTGGAGMQDVVQAAVRMLAEGAVA